MHVSSSALKVIVASTKTATEVQTRNWVIAVRQLYKEPTCNRQTIRVFHIENLKTAADFGFYLKHHLFSPESVRCHTGQH